MAMTSLLRFAGALALGAVACGARTSVGGVVAAMDDAGASFPVGTYTSCAFGTVVPGPFLMTSGFDYGATMTVTENGDARTATFVDGSGGTSAWTFTTKTNVSAALAPGAQTAGFGSSICVYGVGASHEKFFPTRFDATSGALTYQSGVVFVALDGELTSHADCGDMSASARVWIGCMEGPAPVVTAPASTSPFPSGDYACTSQIGTHATLDGKNAFITSGNRGALRLTQTGAHVTARYTGDTELVGTLALTLDTATTGSADANQTLTARCELDPTTGELDITAASLTAEGDTVFVSFAGAMSASSACPSAKKIATLVCTKK